MLAAPPLLRPLLVLCLLLPIVLVSTALVNITIDDTDGDASQDSTLTFSPVGFWAQGQDCPTCNVHSGNTTDTIDVSQVFDGTWHDSTFHPGDPDHTITASFIGTAVYVYNIIGNQIPSTITFTNLTFWINSDLVGSYVHPPENTAGFEYGVLVYANTSLPNGQHFLTIRAGGGPNASLILFDRLVYTQDSNSSLSPSGPSVSISFPSSTPLPATSAPASGSSKSSPPIGAIVGGVVGGVVGLAILGLVAFLVFRAQRQTAAPPPRRRSTRSSSAAGHSIPKADRCPALPSSGCPTCASGVRASGSCPGVLVRP
ncbi:hypothetical protein GSI_05561 [Ganoderma sinense ZZ0214-1]|uniref:Transporter n=1 Tax=Ganoderma sinense ZZ0214-1 TaxID=1077348 RepID=A0A2G8SEW3_9APHY|nr:hypothetical protein GSI_05561 [Ganoderma sinense ZZ0214-1]